MIEDEAIHDRYSGFCFLIRYSSLGFRIHLKNKGEVFEDIFGGRQCHTAMHMHVLWNVCIWGPIWDDPDLDD